LTNNLQLAQLTHSELQMISKELKERNGELKTATAELEGAKMLLSTSSGQLVVVTHNYEQIEQNCQQTITCLYRAVVELKAELDSHSGINEELAAAAELILARGNVVEAAIDIEEAKNQLFHITSELIGANDDIGILEGLYRCRDFQDNVAEQTEGSQSLFQKLNGWAIEQGERKRMARQLFQIEILRPHFIKMSFNNIRQNTYTPKSIARVMDLHQGFNLCGLDAFRFVEPAYVGPERLLWSLSSVKKVYGEIEKDMKQEIFFTLIRARNEKGQIVDGIKVNTKDLFVYLVNHFGLSEKAKTGNIEIAITADGAPLDDKTGRIAIGLKICDKDAIDQSQAN
jgi:hypothetical protein